MASTATATSRVTARSPAALKEALLAALVTFVLLAPLLGMRTASGPDGMTLEFHFGWVLIACALVFAGRLLMVAWRGRPGGMTLPGGAALAAARRRDRGAILVAGGGRSGVRLRAAVPAVLQPLCRRHRAPRC